MITKQNTRGFPIRSGFTPDFSDVSSAVPGWRPSPEEIRIKTEYTSTGAPRSERRNRSPVIPLFPFVEEVRERQRNKSSSLFFLPIPKSSPMETVKNLLKPKLNPQQQLREWQRRLRQECRNIERQIRDVQREEKNVQKAIKEAAKRNDVVSAKALAKEIVRSRRAVNRLYENKAQLNSISMHLGEIVATARTVGHLSKSAEVMKLVNNLMKAPEVAATMQEFSKEMTKAGVIEEMVNDAVDSALDSEDIEEETEEEVDKVLDAIAGETASQLPDAVRRERLKQPSASEAVEEREAIAEGIDDGELEEMRARLARVRS
ncbi:putative Vacuolar protein sorting-associated protein 24 [Cocos nucifera]|uniref:Putative Vacuolar protein sorting-associated protein 24 n=1 Tax=Cocos nucifera TaxID=13894 RepID=A0A8K0IFP7_COCNU|nr:putative Vacuolar protein sorting-associated protein 24 [Cocos nucifera]